MQNLEFRITFCNGDFTPTQNPLLVEAGDFNPKGKLKDLQDIIVDETIGNRDFLMIENINQKIHKLQSCTSSNPVLRLRSVTVHPDSDRKD
ncbi:hypothetical protein [Dolichospermum sp. UHCC 0260]|jgi:hypothetical protein|uniref:hypothetical protein n=1 Tax=Dolichospermum sp. UHCC 0260 TaxID=2590025 RepID=UPI0014477F0B|nr:hypothetical protein [Dolichospermum sp. UHCC 0260]MTJ35063.1 hypothetical protein [Dolichospermum sp. UHCC 0260]